MFNVQEIRFVPNHKVLIDAVVAAVKPNTEYVDNRILCEIMKCQGGWEGRILAGSDECYFFQMPALGVHSHYIEARGPALAVKELPTPNLRKIAKLALQVFAAGSLDNYLKGKVK